MRIFRILCIFSLIVSCKSDKNKVIKEDTYDWLMGSWQVENDTTRLETWNKVSTLSYTGIGLKNVGTDSMHAYEYLRLFKLDNKWQLTAQVQNQNEGKEITFVQNRMSSDKVLSVENRSHDFPKSIEYLYLTDSAIVVDINKGMQNGIKYKLNKVLEEN